MLGPETEEESNMLNNITHSYRQTSTSDIVIEETPDPQSQIDEGTSLNATENDVELFLPTVTKLGAIRRYRKNVMKKIKKNRIEDQNTLLDMDYDNHKGGSIRLKSNLEKFFHTTGAIDSMDDYSENKETMTMIQNIIDKEFPDEKLRMPTQKELIRIGEQEKNRARYGPGDWVEIEGLDMIWRLDMITRVIRQAPDDWDWKDPKNEGKEPEWTFFYNAGGERHIKEEDLRSSEAGLKALFGCRPWVWQQWAILKVEEKLRFQEGHQDDFESKDIQKYASDLWEEWLTHPANSEFFSLFYDDRIGERGRAELMTHIQKPFELIDKMTEKDNEEWDFSADENINIFTYVSLLGSGTLIPMTVLAVQIAIPTLLILQSNKDSSCKRGDDLEPELLYTKVVGGANTVYSKIISLRRIPWNQGDDTLLQSIGFKLDIYMNTMYQSMLMMLNIYIILETDELIEVVLNALAFIFIAQIDEDLARTGWYDADNRWLTAGAMQTAMLGTIQLRVLSSPQLFSKHFDIHEELLLHVCDNDNKLLCNAGVAQEDSRNPMYKTMDEQICSMCADIAEDNGNKNAMSEYKKDDVYFGLLQQVSRHLCGHAFGTPAFSRFKPWRTWSRWQKVLFLSPVPSLESDEVFEVNVKKRIEERKLENFYPNEARSNIRIFFEHFWRVLIFVDMIPTLKPVCSLEDINLFLFRLLDGIFLNWTCYVIHIIFPLYLLAAFYEVVYNFLYWKCAGSGSLLIDSIFKLFDYIFN